MNFIKEILIVFFREFFTPIKFMIYLFKKPIPERKDFGNEHLNIISMLTWVLFFIGSLIFFPWYGKYSIPITIIWMGLFCVIFSLSFPKGKGNT